MSAERDVKVVGLSFIDGYPRNLTDVEKLVEAAHRRSIGYGDGPGPEQVDVLLMRNPENEHDSNAVEVHIPALGRRASMVGHLPRDLAARIAPSMDRGEVWVARVIHVLRDPDFPDRPGIEIRLARLAETAA